jgi:5'(3')-deoxyribonucleotidase
MTHIAIDMDDVLVDFVGGLCKAIQTERGITITAEDITQWDLHPILDPIIGYNWWTWLRKREWLWANFDAVPGAIGGIDSLRQQGHYVELLTSKPEWAEHNVWKWLGKWRPALHRVTIIGPEQHKVNFTDAMILIDDKIDNCISFAFQGRDAILFTRPHNQAYKPAPSSYIYRANGWNEVLERVKELTNG